MKPLVFHSAARLELAEAVRWYDDRALGLGTDLVTEVELATRLLRKSPELCMPHKQTRFRKIFVRRFPYTIYFLELPDRIWIAAVAHQSRLPGYWSKRLP